MAHRASCRRPAPDVRLRRGHQAVATHRSRTRWASVGALTLSALVVAVVVAGFIASPDQTRHAATAKASGGAGAGGHIHDLGVDPADGSLVIATHRGLFRARPGSAQTERLAGSQADLMSFAVAGPDHFLASGHPGAGADQPSHLGLVEIRDGGQTWKALSLAGQADFHVLQVAGSRVYAFDAARDRLLESTDLGREWTRRDVPGTPFDIAIDPNDPKHLLLAADDGVHRSPDAGRSWSRVSEQIVLLAWAVPERLLMVDGTGRVLLSHDDGRSSRQVGRVDGQAVALTASADAFYIALADGTVLQSSDGTSFRVRTRL
jgi:hypothetical protein